MWVCLPYLVMVKWWRSLWQDQRLLLILAIIFLLTRLFKVDVYNSDHGPFLYITQYKLATHLVTMDIETFTQMAESLPKQDIKVLTDIQNLFFVAISDQIFQVIIVANTGRCGSTLLAQMFEAVEGTSLSNFGLFALTSHLLMRLRSAWICLDLE